jgi:hypothetical protein
MRKALKRSVVAGLAATIVMLIGASGASADPKNGFVIRITCGSETTTTVSPTIPAAVAHDPASTRVFVLAVGEFFAPEQFPEGKVVLCDLENLTTGDTFEDLPFLIKGAP